MQLTIPNQKTVNALNAPLEDKAYDNVDQLFENVLNETSKADSLCQLPPFVE